MSSTVLIIGDAFSAFSNGCSALTKDQFFRLPEDYLANINKIIIGQGVRPIDLKFIYAFLADKCLLSCIEVEEYLSSKIEAHAVHKRLDKNVMITRPRQLDDDTFSANLVVDDDCAEISDHVTGVHMQGMLFVEAARQLFMSITPDFGKRLDFDSTTHQYALKEVGVTYRKFLYPMPIEILLKINAAKNLKRIGIYTAETSFQFKQFGEIGVEISCKATAHDKKSLTHMEEIEATRQLEKLLMQQRNRNAFRILETRI